MPGHVHTLGILRHSRSRHDRHNLDTFGEDQETAAMAAVATGDPLLDARMVEEEDINIQLNQVKCDNPYEDD